MLRKNQRTYVVRLQEGRRDQGNQEVHQSQVRQGSLRQIRDQVLPHQVQDLSGRRAGLVQQGAQHQVQPPKSQQW